MIVGLEDGRDVGESEVGASLLGEVETSGVTDSVGEGEVGPSLPGGTEAPV